MSARRDRRSQDQTLLAEYPVDQGFGPPAGSQLYAARRDLRDFRKGGANLPPANRKYDWQQDDSPDHDLWHRLDWRRAHGNEGSDGLFRYFNGGFLSAKGMAGKVVVRGNRIRDAYNGVRMKADSADPEQVPKLNADIHIIEND